jgi:hypothetical protein
MLGAWRYDQIRRLSLERIREIPYFTLFGAQLKFVISAHEKRLCANNAKRVPKGAYLTEWIEGSDSDGCYCAVMQEWKQERIHKNLSPEAYFDLQMAAAMALDEINFFCCLFCEIALLRSCLGLLRLAVAAGQLSPA